MNLDLIFQYLQLELLHLRSLNDENISASIFLLQKVEEFIVEVLSSFQVALKFSDAVMQREHPVKSNLTQLN